MQVLSGAVLSSSKVEEVLGCSDVGIKGFSALPHWRHFSQRGDSHSAKLGWLQARRGSITGIITAQDFPSSRGWINT